MCASKAFEYICVSRSKQDGKVSGKGAIKNRLKARNLRRGIIARRKRNIWKKMRQHRGV